MAYKRKIVLINPKFQLKFSLFVCAVVLISTLVYPLTIYNVFDQVMTKAPQFEAEMSSLQGDLLITLLIYQLLYTLGIFIICIYITHRIAGPLYKLRMYMKSFKDGNPLGKLHFRKSDNFQELADEYNQMTSTQTEKIQQLFSTVNETIAEIKTLKSDDEEERKSCINRVEESLTKLKNSFNLI